MQVLFGHGSATAAPEVKASPTNIAAIRTRERVRTRVVIVLDSTTSNLCGQLALCKMSGKNRLPGSLDSASSIARASCEVSHWPNGSSQVILNRRSFGHRFYFRVVPTHQTMVSSCQSSTIVLIGSAVGLRSSPQNSNVRSTITSVGLLLLPTSAHPLDRCPPLSQLLCMCPLHTGDLIEDGCLHRSWAGPLRCRVRLCPGFRLGL
jgi:hypothetical protein